MSPSTTSKRRRALLALALALASTAMTTLALTAPALAASGGQTGFGFNAAKISGFPAGQGVRWDTEALLASTGFKCTGAAGEARKTATTGHGTVVLQSDFYRAGDGIDESFRAQLIVSQHDIAPDIPGVQNVWVQGIGCGSAIVHFSSPS